jgi:hypothetical protein
MDREIQSQPQHFGVSQKPDTESDPDDDHRGEDDGIGFNAEYVLQEWPHSERYKDRDAISDRDVRKEIATLTHEVITTAGTLHRCIQIALKDPDAFTCGAAKPNDGGDPHAPLHV